MTGPGTTWRRYLPPTGAVISLLLIGLVLLNALLYYRAVKIQRFLEPALALSQPRNEFTRRINVLFRQEFGERPVNGLQVRRNAIQMKPSVVFAPDGKLKPEGKKILNKLAHVFLVLLQDDTARSEIDHILVVNRFSQHEAPGANVSGRIKAYLLVGFIQDALFLEVPALGRGYREYFMTATGALYRPEDVDVVEFVVVPSEFLHIKVLDRLEKYAN